MCACVFCDFLFCVCLHVFVLCIPACVLWAWGWHWPSAKGRKSVWRRTMGQPGCSALFHRKYIVRFEDGYRFEYHRSLAEGSHSYYCHIFITLHSLQTQHKERSPPTYIFYYSDNFYFCLTDMLFVMLGSSIKFFKVIFKISVNSLPSCAITI